MERFGATGHDVLCFDAVTRRVVPLRRPDRGIARPNRSFVVAVRHCPDQVPTIQLNGDHGLSTPRLRDERSDGAQTLLDEARQRVQAVQNEPTDGGTDNSDTSAQLEQAIEALQEAAENVDPGETLTLRLVQRARDGLTQARLRGQGGLPADTRDEVLRLINEAITRTGPARDRLSYRIYARAFGPRRPGTAGLEIELYDAEGLQEHPDAGTPRPQAEEELHDEIQIVRQYAGALRTGLGVVLGSDAVPPSFEARTGPGSTTLEIAQSGGGTAAFEIVLGVAPFIFDLIAWGGRSYEDAHNFYFAPFIGLGVLSGTDTGVDAFSSLYLGAEFELMPEVSVVGAFVIRRVQRLGPGLSPGGPIDTSPVPMRDDFGMGGAIVINVTPDVFRFGSPNQGREPENDDESGNDRGDDQSANQGQATAGGQSTDGQETDDGDPVEVPDVQTQDGDSGDDASDAGDTAEDDGGDE